MTKRRRKGRRRARRPKSSPQVLRRQGAQAFQRGDYDLAIAAWRRVRRDQRDAKLTVALAEACFRHGLRDHLGNLHQAVNVAGDEPRYVYHLALAYHRAGRLDEAEPLYRRVLGRGEGDIGYRAAYVLGLLLLQSDRRPSRDPLWEQLEGAADGSPLAAARRQLAWAEDMIFTRRPAPPGPAPSPLWEAVAARRAGRDDPTPVDPDSGPGTEAAVAHNHLAARAWERGDAESALSHWRTAHQAGLNLPGLDDNLFAAARTVATERLKADDADGALQVAATGLGIRPDDKGLKTIASQAHFRLGHAAALVGGWEEAHEHWLAALEVGGERSRRLVINLALAKEQQESWHEAAELWREALRRRPRKADHPDALNDTQVARLWRHVAENYRRVGHMYEAQRTFQNALKWAPDDSELRTAYVDLLLDDGRLVAADNQLELLLRAHPDDVELIDRRAQIYAGQGYAFDAMRLWKQVLELQPDHPSAGRQIARQYESLGDDAYHWGWVQRAMARYREGLKYTPHDGVLLVSMGMCHLDLGQEEQARQFFDRAYAAEPTNLNVYMIATKTWLDHDNWAAAQAVIRHAREATELPPAFFLDIAAFCYGRYRWDLAQDYLEEALNFAPDDPDLLLVAANVASNGGDADLALELLQDVLQLEPDNDVAHMAKGIVLAQQGRLSEARRCWDRAEQIAQEIDNHMVLTSLEEIRFLYDPDRLPPLQLLRHMLGESFYDDDDLDEDEEWFYE